MSALPKTQPYFTVEEYFAHEERADDRSEYYRGEIFAMAGGSLNHNQIVGNLYTALRRGIDQSCRVCATDLRLFTKGDQFFTYPDIMVICGSLRFAPGRLDTVTNPVIIMEVLSPSTETYDRGKKFEFYRAISTLKEYILVDQNRFYVEHYQRQTNNTWLLTAFGAPESVLRLPSIELSIVLATIYERVEWEQE